MTMKFEEKYAILLNELFDGIDQGHFRDTAKIPANYTFNHMAALLYYAQQLEGGVDLYKQLHAMVTEAAKASILQKLKQKEKIKITFLAISAAEWPADDLYRMLDQDDRFDVTVTICPLVDRGVEDRTKTYLQNREFFSSRGYCMLDVYHPENDQIFSWKDIGWEPDIVIHLTYWSASLPTCFQINHFPLNRMNINIAYGFEAGNSMNGKYLCNVGYNKEFMNLVNKVYVNSRIDYDGFCQHQLLAGANVAYSGYAKMDFFFRKKDYSEEQLKSIWKIPESSDVKRMKKVIIAPHHSFLGYAGILFSTFGQNAHFWLYLAEKYKDEISFLFKPHPNLRYRAVEAKIFSDAEEYDKYVARWNSLPNAKVVVEGSYLDAFATSDAMMMDSISFIAEYMYVNKPVLYLTRKEQVFSPLGECCMQAYEKAEGGEYLRIERFLKEVVLGEKDSMAATRQEVLDSVLNYVKDNGCLASEYVYKDLLEMIGVRMPKKDELV